MIEKPENDPDWWKARNQSGDTGLVPKNYVQVVVTPSPASTTPKPSTPVPQPAIAPRPELHAKEWYFGSISRSQCDQVLNDHAVDGDFLIRDSETNVGDLSVSLKAPQRNKHFRVHVEDGVYCIGQRRFSNLDDLVEHYKRAPIYTSPKGDKMYLVRPFRKP